MKNLKIYIVLFIMGFSTSILAQETKKVIHEAMELEMSRNLKNLQLEGMKDPFFIGTNILDANNILIDSNLGNLVRISESPARLTWHNRMIVGSYSENNLNFSNPGLVGKILPLDNSSTEIRRILWMMYDKDYKTSAELYESKQSALKNKPQDEDIVGLEDYTPGVKVIVDKPEILLAFETSKLTQYMNDISFAFRDYPSLTSSNAILDGAKSNIYYQNTEGTRATYPLSCMKISLNAETQASNGEILSLSKSYHFLNESGLPPKEQVIKDVHSLSDLLMKLKDAPVFDDVYYGPVLFEGELTCQSMFRNSFLTDGLYSVRKPVIGNTGSGIGTQTKISSDDRLDKKISHESLNMVAKPFMSTFEGQPLLGSYPIDMEGTVPPKTTVLVENGILKTQLCGRIPTRKIKESNGHFRMGRIFESVIDVDFKDAVSKKDLRKKLIKMAEEEGLDFAIIVRDMDISLGVLKLVYKVDIKTGTETMMRTAGFKPFTFSDLRKLVGASNHKIVSNTSIRNVVNLGVSYITPDAFLFKDLEVNKVSITNLSKIPVVKNPLEL